MPVRAPKRTLSDISELDTERSTKRIKVDKRKHHVDLNDPQIRVILREVKTSGTVFVCGQGDVGQLGLGEDVMEKLRFAHIPDYTNVVSVAAGGMHNICLTKDGKVLTFGCNDEGALGRSTTEEGSETVPGFVDLPAPAVQVTAGDSHSAALLQDGRVFVWGSFRDSHGSMGLFNKNSERLPVQAPLDRKFIKIASGSDHLVLLDNMRLVYTCGCGEQGQLGRLPEKKTDRHCRQGVHELLTPGQVYFKKGKQVYAENIWAGSYATFVKSTEKNELYVFGLNNYNQIGLKGDEKVYHPKMSKTFSGKNWVEISSGQHHTIALDDEGKVYVIGRKEYGRLGLGAVESDATELTLVPTFENVKCSDIAAGSAQSFAVTEDGKLYAWGMGTSGQLGTGEEEDAEEPRLITSKQLKDAKVMRVSGGGQHTIVLGYSTVKPETVAAKKQDVQSEKIELVEEKVVENKTKDEENVKVSDEEVKNDEKSNETAETEPSSENVKKDEDSTTNTEVEDDADVKMQMVDENEPVDEISEKNPNDSTLSEDYQSSEEVLKNNDEEKLEGEIKDEKSEEKELIGAQEDDVDAEMQIVEKDEKENMNDVIMETQDSNFEKQPIEEKKEQEEEKMDEKKSEEHVDENFYDCAEDF